MPTTINVTSTAAVTLRPTDGSEPITIAAATTQPLAAAYLYGADFENAVLTGTLRIRIPADLSSLSVERRQLARTVAARLFDRLGSSLIAKFSILDAGMKALAEARDSYNARHRAVKALIEANRQFDAAATHVFESTKAFVSAELEDQALAAAAAAVRALAPADPDDPAAIAQLDAAIAAYEDAKLQLASAQALYVAARAAALARLGTASEGLSALHDSDAAQDIGTEITWPSD